MCGQASVPDVCATDTLQAVCAVVETPVYECLTLLANKKRCVPKETTFHPVKSFRLLHLLELIHNGFSIDFET